MIDSASYKTVIDWLIALQLIQDCIWGVILRTYVVTQFNESLLSHRSKVKQSPITFKPIELNATIQNSNWCWFLGEIPDIWIIQCLVNKISNLHITEEHKNKPINQGKTKMVCLVCHIKWFLNEIIFHYWLTWTPKSTFTKTFFFHKQFKIKSWII